MPGSPHQANPKPWMPLSTYKTVISPFAVPGARPPSCLLTLQQFHTITAPPSTPLWPWTLGTSAHAGHHEETRQREGTWRVQAAPIVETKAHPWVGQVDGGRHS